MAPDAVQSSTQLGILFTCSLITFIPERPSSVINLHHFVSMILHDSTARENQSPSVDRQIRSDCSLVQSFAILLQILHRKFCGLHLYQLPRIQFLNIFVF